MSQTPASSVQVGGVGEWREYPGDPRYEVCDQGLVRMKGRNVRKPSSTPFGYQVIVTREGGRAKGRYVHQMVMETFVGPRPEGHTVSHLNGICTDNRVTNLSYETMKNNQRRKVEHGTQTKGAAHHSSKLTPDQVVAIRKTNDRTWRELAAEYGVHLRTIARVKMRDTYKEV